MEHKLTPIMTTTFSVNAMNPALMSFTSGGAQGIRLAIFTLAVTTIATVTTPTMMPVAAPTFVI